jgi:hypothetical protein
MRFSTTGPIGRRVFAHLITIAIIAGVWTASAIAFAAELPNLRAGTPYRAARVALKKTGWHPYAIPGAEGCPWSSCKAYPETITCYGVGSAPCLYAWERGRSYLLVRGEGEGPQTLRSIERCRGYADTEFGWRCLK